MINYAYEGLFEQNSIDKQYSIEIYNENILEGTITNNELYSGAFEHQMPLCTEDTLRYGACESAYIKFTVISSVGTLKNRKLLVYVTPEGGTKLQLGEFYVDSDELSDDRQSREIIAYDKLYTIINTDMLKWYREVGLPLSMKNFRDAFFEYFGLEQLETTLCNDGMIITEVEEVADQLSGLDVLSSILAGNGCLGTINNEGKFRYVTFTDYDTKSYGTHYKQGSLVYEDYLVQPIATLIFTVQNKEIVVGADPTSSSNIYRMEDNFLFYDKLEADLAPYVQNIFDVIKLTPAFRPLRADTYGDPCVELGDMATFTTPEGNTLRTFVLEKVEKGLVALSDEYEIKGTEYYVYDLNDGNSKIRRLWNNTLELVSNAKCYVYAHRNSGVSFDIGHTTNTTIITIPLASEDECIPVFVATIPLVMSVDGEITFRYFLDDIEINPNDNDTIYLTRGEQFVTLSSFIEMPANARKRFTVTAQTGYRQSVEREQTAKIISLKDWIDNQSITVDTQTGTASFDYDYVEHPVDTTPPGAFIDSGKIRAMIFASGLAKEQPWDGTITIAEPISNWNIENVGFANAIDSVTVNVQVPIGDNIQDSTSGWAIVGVTFSETTDSVFVVTHAQSFPIITEDEEALITEDGIRFYTEGD